MHLAAQYAAFAATRDDPAALCHEACRMAASGVPATSAQLLMYCPDERDFIVQAGVGWRDGVVGRVRLDADTDTAAGFALHSGQGLISNRLAREPRYRACPVLKEHGIVRSITLAVPKRGGVGFGVLVVGSAEPGRFTGTDAMFLDLLAGSLAAGLERVARQATAAQELASCLDDHQKSYAELCHRLRNDLQLLCIAADRASRTGAGGDGFDRIQRQMQALATLYDHLLDIGPGADEIDLGAYLQSLCRKITHAADLPARRIALVTDMQAVTIRSGRAVQIGIAVNELVANAAEHAFAPASPGRILVSLQPGGPGRAGDCTLTIADDGCGFVQPEAGGLGIGFVRRLASRAGAELTCRSDTGTTWRLSFAA